MSSDISLGPSQNETDSETEVTQQDEPPLLQMADQTIEDAQQVINELPFKHTVFDQSQPDDIVNPENLYRLRGSTIWEDQPNFQCWSTSPAHNALYLKANFSSGLTEWILFFLLSHYHVGTPNISAKRDRHLLVSDMEFLIAYETNQQAMSAAHILLHINSLIQLQFSLYRLEQHIVFPINYSYLPLQFAFSGASYTTMDITGINYEMRWFTTPIHFDQMYYYIPVPGCLLGNFHTVTQEIFYKYRPDMSKFLPYQPRNQSISIYSAGIVSTQFQNRRASYLKNFRQTFFVRQFNHTQFYGRIPIQVDMRLANILQIDQERQAYMCYYHICEPSRRIAENRARQIASAPS